MTTSRLRNLLRIHKVAIYRYANTSEQNTSQIIGFVGKC